MSNLYNRCCNTPQTSIQQQIKRHVHISHNILLDRTICSGIDIVPRLSLHLIVVLINILKAVYRAAVFDSWLFWGTTTEPRTPKTTPTKIKGTKFDQQRGAQGPPGERPTAGHARGVKKAAAKGTKRDQERSQQHQKTEPEGAKKEPVAETLESSPFWAWGHPYTPPSNPLACITLYFLHQLMSKKRCADSLGRAAGRSRSMSLIGLSARSR